MTANERKAAERQRRKDAGLVRCEVWVKPEQVEAVKAFVKVIDGTARHDNWPKESERLASGADFLERCLTRNGVNLSPHQVLMLIDDMRAAAAVMNATSNNA